jgi:hypothetical protein
MGEKGEADMKQVANGKKKWIEAKANAACKSTLMLFIGDVIDLKTLEDVRKTLTQDLQTLAGFGGVANATTGEDADNKRLRYRVSVDDAYCTLIIKSDGKQVSPILPLTGLMAVVDDEPDAVEIRLRTVMQESERSRRLCGRMNIWVCTSCGYRHVAVDIDFGVTPFYIPCEKCGGSAQSVFYRVPGNNEYIPEFEWFRPTESELREYLDAIEEKTIIGIPEGTPKADIDQFILRCKLETIEHVGHGGLIRRPMAPGYIVTFKEKAEQHKVR